MRVSGFIYPFSNSPRRRRSPLHVSDTIMILSRFRKEAQVSLPSMSCLSRPTSFMGFCSIFVCGDVPSFKAMGAGDSCYFCRKP